MNIRPVEQRLPIVSNPCRFLADNNNNNSNNIKKKDGEMFHVCPYTILRKQYFCTILRKQFFGTLLRKQYRCAWKQTSLRFPSELVSERQLSLLVSQIPPKIWKLSVCASSTSVQGGTWHGRGAKNSISTLRSNIYLSLSHGVTITPMKKALAGPL